MSFSTQVKEELGKHISSARHCQMAELVSMMHFAGYFGKTEDDSYVIGFRSDNPDVLRKGFTLWKKTFNIDSVMTAQMAEKCAVFEKIGDLSAPVNEVIIKNACCKRAFLRGAYLAIGSMSDPNKSYHLEFVCESMAQAKQLQEVIADFDIEAKIVQRKGNSVVYVKEGSAIVELLNIMEAHVSLMDYENSRILKEVRNTVNRRVNCETANIKKTVNAASKQLEDILFIRDQYGFEKLPDRLREMAEVRLEYPEATLQELGEQLNPPVGKSGVNHRLRSLSEIAERMRVSYPEEENYD